MARKKNNVNKAFFFFAIVFGLLIFYANSGAAPEGDDPIINLKIDRSSGSPLFNFPFLNTGGGGGSTVPPVDNTTTPDPITPDVIVCGDLLCDNSENDVSCPVDCPTIIIGCGDGFCSSAENSVLCPEDCYVIAPTSPYRQPHPASSVYTPKATVINNFKSECAKAPTKCSYEIIGKSIENRDIYLFKIGNPVGGRVMIDGSIHGWEDSGTELSYELMKWLLTSNVEEARHILEHNYLLIIPIINMDKTTRQNARRTYLPELDLTSSKGVDLNRNFCAGWSSIIGLSDPNADYPNAYKGPYCESEPETRAVVYAVKTYKPDVYVNFHMGGTRYWGGCGNSVLVNDIKARYAVIANEIGVPKYNLGGACGNGQATAGAVAYGAKTAWLTETQTTNLVPQTRQQFIDEFYPMNYPMLMAMLEAVEK